MDLTNLYFTLAAILVVFAVLFLLYLAYSLIGMINTGKFKRKKITPVTKQVDDEVAAAISMALHQYGNETAHDYESYVITIQRK